MRGDRLAQFGAATDRRAFLAKLAGALATGSLAGLPALAQLAAQSSTPRALVLGNAAYIPPPQSIPSARKNVGDVSDALRRLGFDVARGVDVGADAMRAAIRDLFAKARADSTALVVLYFSGHGIQYDGYNYLVPSDVPLNQAANSIASRCINVQNDVLGYASLPGDAISVLIFDACRNDPTKSDERVAAGAFNQIDPPRGTVITYSTAPGRYAIAPKSADQNSVYTGILVDELRKANAALSVKDFLDAVKFRVRRYMETHEDPFLRKYAQDPEVAANVRLKMSFAIEKLEPAQQRDERDADKALAAIGQTIDPAARVKLLKSFIASFPDSRSLQAAQVQLERALLTVAALQKNPVQIEATAGNADFRADQAKALDGDKDAAYRVAQMYEGGSNGLPRDETRKVQWLRLASALKNGIASYKLYEHYRDRRLDVAAVNYENLACSQGYILPTRVPTSRGAADQQRQCPP